MFNLSFAEIAVILAVCLVVVGPKRLPEMARFVGHLFGRINQQARALRADIRREMELEDLRSIAREAENEARKVSDVMTGSIAESDTLIKESLESAPAPKAAGSGDA